VTKVGVVGAAGKMGRTLIALIHDSDQLELVAAVEQPGSSSIGVDAGDLANLSSTGVIVSDDLNAVASSIDVLIDFTIAPATVSHLEICLQHGARMVIGTTGLDNTQRERLIEVGQDIPIVFASNYSIGVNATFRLVEMAAEVFGESVDIEIIETHHRHKVDAPSGTALSLGEHIAGVLDRKIEDVAVFGRHGLTGARDRETIGIHAIRAGDIIGEHKVIFAGTGERLEITHRAQSRDNFAQGAVRAATWLAAKEAGVYDMQDVLGLKESGAG
jgi:4-hydroxy-tetrahydrodipicolinate reductase